MIGNLPETNNIAPDNWIKSMVVEDYLLLVCLGRPILRGEMLVLGRHICICLKSVGVKCVNIHPSSNSFGHHLSSFCRHFVQEGKTQARNVQAVWCFFWYQIYFFTFNNSFFGSLETAGNHTVSSLGHGSLAQLEVFFLPDFAVNVC